MKSLSRFYMLLCLLCQKNDGFAMIGEWEHVKGITDLSTVAKSAENADIARLRLGIAGDVDDTFGAELAERLKKARGTARAGRVDEGGVDTRAILSERGGIVLAVGGCEADVLYAVQLGVLFRVADGGRIQLDRVDELCLAGCDDADGADPAVGVEDGFGSAEIGKLYRFGIKPFGLIVVDLIERGGGEEKFFTAQDVGDRPLAEKDLALPACEQLAAVAVDGDDGGGQVGTRLLQGGREGTLRGKDAVRAVDDDHTFSRRGGFTDHNAFQPPSAGIVVVGLNLEALKELCERFGELIRFGGADRAALSRHDAVGRGFVQTAHDTLALALVDELRLVAIAHDLRGRGDFLHAAHRAELSAADILFVSQLFLIA